MAHLFVTLWVLVPTGVVALQFAYGPKIVALFWKEIE